MAAATDFAWWILVHSAGRPVTHLKLQKLAFYCYGAASAHDKESAVGDLRFEAWEHGPVNRAIYDEYRSFGSAAIDVPRACREYPTQVTAILSDALTVYGSLDAWSLRQQSHLEEPWSDARRAHAAEIEPRAIKEHFRRKFCAGRVAYPEYVADTGSFKLDRIPVHGFDSLAELATAVRRSGS